MLPLLHCSLDDSHSQNVLAVNYMLLVVVQAILVPFCVATLELFQLHQLYDFDVLSLKLLLDAMYHVDEVFRAFF